MSKTLVTYYSRSGNTREVAKAIYDAVEGQKALRSIDGLAPGEVEGYDLVFIGFPVHAHSVPHAIHDFIKSIPEGKKIAFFSTHGSLAGSRLSREALENATVLASGARVLGTFACRGRVTSEAMEALQKTPEHKAWTGMAVSAQTHPDSHDLAEARSFAAWILTLAALD